MLCNVAPHLFKAITSTIYMALLDECRWSTCRKDDINRITSALGGLSFGVVGFPNPFLLEELQCENLRSFFESMGKTAIPYGFLK